MKELIIYFSPEKTDAYFVQKSGKSLAILDFHRYKDEVSFSQFLKKHKIKSATAVFEDDETVVKGITIPLLYAEDLESFVSNNINEYFVLDANDYEVDYRITSIQRKEKEMHLMLTAIKKDNIRKVKNFFAEKNIRLKRLTVMPDYLMNLLKDEKKKSVATLRVQGRSAWIHIERENNLFLHTDLEYEEHGGKPTEGTLENISYYLNFYSRQYFGETIDTLMVQVERRFEQDLTESLKSVYDGDIGTLPLPVYENPEKSLLGDASPDEAWILGALGNDRAIFGKKIDFSSKRDRYIGDNRIRILLGRVSILLLLTLFIQGGFILLENYMKSFYTEQSVVIPEEKILEVNNKLEEIRKKEKELLGKAEILTNISLAELDFMEYLRVLQESLPRDTRVERIYFSQLNMDVTFSFQNESTRTLDAARTVLALNDTDVFEPIQLSALSMDDTQEYLDLSLVYKVPVDELAEGEKEGASDGE